MTKTTKKKTAKKTAQRRTKPAPKRAAAVPRAMDAVPEPDSGRDMVALAPATPAPRPPAPRTRTRLLSPAQRRGSRLVRALRVHAKTPYGVRGERAIYLMAREVARLGLQQLEEVAASQ